MSGLLVWVAVPVEHELADRDPDAVLTAFRAGVAQALASGAVVGCSSVAVADVHRRWSPELA